MYVNFVLERLFTARMHKRKKTSTNCTQMIYFFNIYLAAKYY